MAQQQWNYFWLVCFKITITTYLCLFQNFRFKNVKYLLKFEWSDFFMTLLDIALLLSQNDYSS